MANTKFQIIGSVGVLNPYPVDDRYGPFSSISEALLYNVPARRFPGLTVGVTIGGVTQDYAWQNDLTDAGLILKVDVPAILAEATQYAAANVIGSATPSSSPTGTELAGQSYRASNTTGAEVTYANFLTNVSDGSGGFLPVKVPAKTSGLIIKNQDGWALVLNEVDLSGVVKDEDIDRDVDGTPGKVADATAFLRLYSAFDIILDPVTLFDGSATPLLDISINEGASKVWKATNKSAIVPVSAGTKYRIEGRTGQTDIPMTNVWLTSNTHVIDETPDFLTGDFATSSFLGDGDFIAPDGALFLYVLSNATHEPDIRIYDLSNATYSTKLKDDQLPDSVANDFALKIDKSSIDTEVTGGAGKVADAEKFKTVYDRFEQSDTADYLFDGSVDPHTYLFINEGASKIWKEGNYSSLVPVVEGHLMRVSGRTGQTSIPITNLWLTTNNQTVGDTPDFLGGSFNAALVLGDGDMTVPAGALFLYSSADAPHISTLKVQDVTASSELKLKEDALPNAFVEQVNANSELIPVAKLITTKFTDVAYNRDCNLYLDSVASQPDNGRICNIEPHCDDLAMLRGVKNLKFKPTGAYANFDVKFTLRDFNFNQLDLKVKTVRTVPNIVGDGSTELKIMFLGDSYIDMGLIASECFYLLGLDGDYSITQLGTRTAQQKGELLANPKTEGYSGWTWNNFVNLDSANAGATPATNPFRTGGALDIAAYFTAQGYSGIDILVINLGINDFGFTESAISDSQIATIIAQAKTFMTAFLDAYPSIKIILNLPTLGAMGAFPNAKYDQEYRTNNIARGSLAYLSNFDNGVFSGNVVLCDAGQWVDRTNGFSTTIVQSSDRLGSTITENQYSDPVHPRTPGFYQIADGVYSKIRSVIAGNIG